MRSRLMLFAALLLVALPLLAQNNEIGASYAIGRMSSTTEEDAELRFRQGHGFAVDYNRYWFGALSTDFAYTSLSNDVELRFLGQPLLDLGTLDSKTYSAALQWHFAPHGTFDPYLGAGYARMQFDDLESADLTGAEVGVVEVDDANGFMANGGVNWNLHPHIGLNVDAKYIQAKPDSRAAGDPETVELKLNPWIVSAGVRIRF
jgi:opacity protein-like surface antigen